MSDKRAGANSEVIQLTLEAIAECARMIGRNGSSIDPARLEDLARGTRTLQNAIEFKKRLNAARN